MCIFVLIFNNKYKTMTFFFYLRPLWPKYPPLIFVTLKCLVFIIGILFWLHCSDKIVKTTWQRIMVKSWYNIFAISPTPTHEYSKALLWPKVIFHTEFHHAWMYKYSLSAGDAAHWALVQHYSPRRRPKPDITLLMTAGQDLKSSYF